jgi:hypothetical protein
MSDGATAMDYNHQQTVRTYEDKFKNMHGQVELMEGTMAEMKLAYQKELAQKAAELAVKPKHIQNIVKVSVERKLNIDSIAKKYGRIDTLHITHDTTLYITRVNSVSIAIQDSLSITQYMKKKGWFKRIPYLDVVNYVPGSTIKAINGFRLKTYQTNLNFGPTFSYTWDGKQFRPLIGIGVQLKLFGFKIGKH